MLEYFFFTQIQIDYQLNKYLFILYLVLCIRNRTVGLAWRISELQSTAGVVLGDRIIFRKYCFKGIYVKTTIACGAEGSCQGSGGDPSGWPYLWLTLTWQTWQVCFDPGVVCEGDVTRLNPRASLTCSTVPLGLVILLPLQGCWPPPGITCHYQLRSFYSRIFGWVKVLPSATRDVLDAAPDAMTAAAVAVCVCLVVCQVSIYTICVSSILICDEGPGTVSPALSCPVLPGNDACLFPGATIASRLYTSSRY